MSNEYASPPCAAAEADDVYMGYIGKDELLSELQSLLEAERAGVQVARSSRRDICTASDIALLRRIGADEARWCAMLTREIRRLGEVPSRRRGAFFEKAMDIADVDARLRFLNRGQGWVVRKLEVLAPRVRDDGLHRALREMQESHVVNIAATENALDSRS